jgi:hypothetical protein
MGIKDMTTKHEEIENNWTITIMTQQQKTYYN